LTMWPVTFGSLLIRSAALLATETCPCLEGDPLREVLRVLLGLCE